MNIINTEGKQKKLPQLIKMPATYKLKVPSKVEEKIRYLIRKFPNTEWSGVLFIRHTGCFEEEDLEIICEDLYPMDLGTSGWTEFRMSEDITNYIANNLELFDCDMGLIHSHHTLGAFFSGQDISTLKVEGDDTNCFVSLIVDTRGTYQAAITRKIKQKTQITTKSEGMSYEFFGEGTTQIMSPNEHTEIFDEEVIQYFMLDVEVEKVKNPLGYLDTRFDEIAEKKKAITRVVKSEIANTNYNSPWIPKKNSPKTTNDDFFDWLHSNRKNETETKKPEVTQPTIFSKEEMDELIDVNEWEPDPTVIHYLACQLLTTSLIVNKDIDLKQWVHSHMVKKYDELFGCCDSIEFEGYVEFMVEFIINHYPIKEVPDEIFEDMDYFQTVVSQALADEIAEYEQNAYIKVYLSTLSRYI